MIAFGDKLYIVTRSDLSPGQQAVQSCHAMRQFTAEHPSIDKEWFDSSNYIALVVVDNERKLYELFDAAMMKDIPCSKFSEPDLNNQVTAIALAPCAGAARLCKKLKLALN